MMRSSNLQRLATGGAILASMFLAAGCQIDSSAAPETAVVAQVAATDVRLAVENLPRRGKYL